MNKTAFDIVNESFEKQAGIFNKLTTKASDYKHLLTGKALKQSKKNLDVFDIVTDSIRTTSDSNQRRFGDYKNIIKRYADTPAEILSNKDYKKEYAKVLEGAKDENLYNSVHQNMKDLHETIKKKTRNARIGTGVAVGGAIVGGTAYGLKKRKNNEKTAFDIVNESFEKQAGVMGMAKGLMTATKSLGKNTKNLAIGLGGMLNKNRSFKEIVSNKGFQNAAKNIGKGLVLPGAGIAGANFALNKMTNKQPEQQLNNYSMT